MSQSSKSVLSGECSSSYYYSEHVIVYIPPFRKGGWGGFETWENLPKSPSAKGGFLKQAKTAVEEKQ
jgi:hypothetical protein